MVPVIPKYELNQSDGLYRLLSRESASERTLTGGKSWHNSPERKWVAKAHYVYTGHGGGGAMTMFAFAPSAEEAEQYLTDRLGYELGIWLPAGLWSNDDE